VKTTIGLLALAVLLSSALIACSPQNGTVSYKWPNQKYCFNYYDHATNLRTLCCDEWDVQRTSVHVYGYWLLIEDRYSNRGEPLEKQSDEVKFVRSFAEHGTPEYEVHSDSKVFPYFVYVDDDMWIRPIGLRQYPATY
jgi:hypothetical protein